MNRLLRGLQSRPLRPSQAFHPSQPPFSQPLQAPRHSSSASNPSNQGATAIPLDEMSPAEASIARRILSSPDLTPTTRLSVRDVSGGCGSMYAIDIASPRFGGLSVLKQQRLVNAALGELVGTWHGVQIRTSVEP